jgi:hypothetical protein
VDKETTIYGVYGSPGNCGSGCCGFDPHIVPARGSGTQKTPYRGVFFYQVLPPYGDYMGSTPIRHPSDALITRAFYYQSIYTSPQSAGAGGHTSRWEMVIVRNGMAGLNIIGTVMVMSLSLFFIWIA